MTTVLLYEVIFVFFLCHPTEAFPQSGLDLGGSRTERNVYCRAYLEYRDGNICCLNCPAGTHVKDPCTKAGEKGTCEECEDGKYTEHANGLPQCLKCTVCRSDQEIVRHCTTTQDTECQCKPGTFCAPDQACELCMKCSTCKKDEEKVRNCTSTTNTQCKKIQLNPDSDTANQHALMVTLVGFAAVAVAAGLIVAVIYWRKRCSPTDALRNLPDGMKAGQNPTEETRNGETQRSSCSSWPLEDEQFLKLIPVNGEESLRQCFGYFEEMDVDYHKRFFRHLGITDNVIKSKEHLQYEDKIHELLNVWLEKQGKDASLNDLLKALLELNQRRTAETVKESVIHSGHYVCEC